MPQYDIGEGNPNYNMGADIAKLLKSPVFWLKVLELLLIFLMIALVTNGGYFPSNQYVNISAIMAREFVVFGTMYAYLIINTIIIAGFILDEVVPKKLVLVLTAAGAILFITAGALMIEYWDLNIVNVNDLTLGSGIVGLIVGVIYIADTGFTFKMG